MNEAWTTALGRRLLALQRDNADYGEVCKLDDELKAAFSTLKHIRRCYFKEVVNGQ